MDQITLLQNAVMRASELRESKGGAEARKWKLSHKWLVNPKLQCPYCKEWLESGRVWVIDEGRRYVHRVWKLDGTVVSPNKCHPHVGEGGKICMGSSVSGAQAIVAGLTPGETYGDARLHKWLPQTLGHQCERMERGEWVDVGGHECVDYIAREYFGGEGEEEEHEGEAYCDSCDEYYDENTVNYCERLGQTLCENCWMETHSSCENCSETICEHRWDGLSVTNSYGDAVTICTGCYEDNYFYCEKCSEDLPNEKYHEDGVCEECWAESHFTCENCDEEFENSEESGEYPGYCCRCVVSCEGCHEVFKIEDMYAANQMYCEDCGESENPSQAVLEEAGQQRLIKEEVSDGE